MENPTGPWVRKEGAARAPAILKAALLEQIIKIKRKMSQVQEKHKHAEENYGSELLEVLWHSTRKRSSSGSIWC